MASNKLDYIVTIVPVEYRATIFDEPDHVRPTGAVSFTITALGLRDTSDQEIGEHVRHACEALDKTIGLSSPAQAEVNLKLANRAAKRMSTQ